MGETITLSIWPVGVALVSAMYNGEPLAIATDGSVSFAVAAGAHSVTLLVHLSSPSGGWTVQSGPVIVTKSWDLLATFIIVGR